jgi:hypothetical protein
MSRLDELLKNIDPSKTIDHFNSIVDKALNSYEYPKSPIKDYDLLMKVLSDFYWYVERKCWGLGTEPDPGDDWKRGFCRQLLEREYGRNFQITVMEMAKSGVGGGLYEIFRKIGEAVAQNWINKKIEMEVGKYHNEIFTSYEVFKGAVKEYADKYGHLLPKGLTENDNADLLIEFIDVLKKHPYMIKHMREIGRI